LVEENIKSIAIENSKLFINTLIENKYPFIQIYLFGSYAKGNATKDSDIDLAIISNLPEIDNYDERVRLMKIAVKNNNYLIEPHPFSQKDFEEDTPFINEIKRTGIRIV
jgi:uncharacterized protein